MPDLLPLHACKPAYPSAQQRLEHQHINQFRLCEHCVASIVLADTNEVAELRYRIFEACRAENLHFALAKGVTVVASYLSKVIGDWRENVRLLVEFARILGEYVYVLFFGISFLLSALFPEVTRTKSALEQELERKERERQQLEFRMKRDEQWAWEDARQLEWEARRDKHCHQLEQEVEHIKSAQENEVTQKRSANDISIKKLKEEVATLQIHVGVFQSLERKRLEPHGY